MKYTAEVTINLPREQVVELFDNPDNMSKWMEGLESFTHISGEPGQPGAKSNLVFQIGKRRMEMVETITENQLPEYMAGTYESGKTLNIQKVIFQEINENTTKYIAENEFKMGSFMMRMMGVLMPGAFKKQTLKYMESFKRFAEAEAKQRSKGQ